MGLERRELDLESWKGIGLVVVDGGLSFSTADLKESEGVLGSTIELQVVFGVSFSLS